jgi:hypothetical protein
VSPLYHVSFHLGNERRYLPPAGTTTARSSSALEEGTSTASSIRSSSQVGRSRNKVGGLKGHGARLSSVATILGVLEKLGRAADGLVASVTLLGSEPLGVEGDAEDELVSGETEGEILVDGTSGTLDGDVVGGVVITTVHEIIGHDLERLVGGFIRLRRGIYVDKVDGLFNERSFAGDVGDHVALKSRDSDGELLLADELLDLLKELREGLDLVGLLGVDDLLVVRAVTTGVLHVDV